MSEQTVQDLLADIPEADAPLDGQGAETPAESPSETKPTEPAPTPEGANTPSDEKVPFHEHPRWKQLQQERQEMAARIEELKQAVEQAAPRREEQPVQMPQWWARVYGTEADSREAYALYRQEHEAERRAIREEAKRETIAELESKSAAERRAEADAQRHVEESIAALRADGLKFDENELQKVMEDYTPIDRDGNLDFRKGVEILNLKLAAGKKPSPSTAAAAASAPDGDSSEPPRKDYQTTESIKKLSWDSIRR